MAKAKPKTRKTGQGSIYQRKDGRWGWGITHGYNENGNPKRHQGVAGTREAAVEALNEVITRMRLGLPATDEKQTLATFIDFWMKETIIGKKAPKTVRYYEQMTRLYIVPGIGTSALGKLSAQDIQRFLNNLSKAPRSRVGKAADGTLTRTKLPPISPTTLDHVLATLRAVLQLAWRYGLVSQNQAKKAVIPSPRSRSEAIYLSSDEVTALVTASAGHYMGNLILFAINTGVRLGEATGLRWSDVATDGRSVTIRGQLQRVEGDFVILEPKSASSRRNLPLTQAACASLQGQRANQMLWSSSHGEGFNEMGLVFTGQSGRPLDQKNVDKNLKALCRKAGISKQISFHKLRHTAGTHLTANGVPLNVVKEILGHAQISITADLYSHAVPAAHRAAFDVLERSYQGPE